MPYIEQYWLSIFLTQLVGTTIVKRFDYSIVLVLKQFCCLMLSRLGAPTDI